MSIPPGAWASQGAVGVFDVRTVPGILNTLDLCLIRSIAESPGHSNSTTTGILSGARGGVIF